LERKKEKKRIRPGNERRTFPSSIPLGGGKWGVKKEGQIEDDLTKSGVGGGTLAKEKEVPHPGVTVLCVTKAPADIYEAHD